MQRVREDEVMDQPGLAPSLHRQALDGLGRINWLSRTGGRLWRVLRQVAKEKQLPRLRVLDIACGGGDVTRSLARHAKGQGIPLEIHGGDCSPIALEYAREATAREKLSGVEFHQFDARHDEIDAGYDFIVSTLFLHHLERLDAVLLMRRMRGAARHALLVDDLRRTRRGYYLAWIGGRCLTKSPVVHIDGPISVQAAFSPPEVRTMAAEAGLQGARIQCHWPQRFLLTWVRP